jgi:hypothetical protein
MSAIDAVDGSSIPEKQYRRRAPPILSRNAVFWRARYNVLASTGKLPALPVAGKSP